MSRYLWVTSFILILLFYITKFFDILLRKIKNIHYVVSLVLLCLKETLSFILFIGLISIVILLNKSYDKGQIIQTEDDENLNMKKCGNKLELELDDINMERDNKSNDYNSIEKTNNIEDNTIEIDNLDIKNGKDDNTNKNEEEKLDEEDENLNINKIKETDKLK